VGACFFLILFQANTQKRNKVLIPQLIANMDIEKADGFFVSRPLS
jgi:hypothetical protein